MNVGFFLQGNNADYRAMAMLTIESVRDSMPGVEIHHLTDEHTSGIDGADGTRRLRGDMPMAVSRMLHHAACLGEWLFIDCDVVLKRDVRDVFDDENFDVALTDRVGTITNEAKYAAVMPYNIGVTFSRSQAFWMNIAQHLKNVPEKFQQWEGDQRLICEFMKQGKMPFKVKVLPGLIYNYPPRAADDPRIVEAAIVHYKGVRKKWLLEEIGCAATY